MQTSLCIGICRRPHRRPRGLSLGGSPESLEPVKGRRRAWPRAVRTPGSRYRQSRLLAASSAAQSERDEMGLFLEHALNLERQQRSAGLTGSADCHRARSRWETVAAGASFRRRAPRLSRGCESDRCSTRRVTLGLARCARLGRLANLVRTVSDVGEQLATARRRASRADRSAHISQAAADCRASRIGGHRGEHATDFGPTCWSNSSGTACGRRRRLGRSWCTSSSVTFFATNCDAPRPSVKLRDSQDRLSIALRRPYPFG